MHRDFIDVFSFSFFFLLLLSFLLMREYFIIDVNENWRLVIKIRMRTRTRREEKKKKKEEWSRIGNSHLCPSITALRRLSNSFRAFLFRYNHASISICHVFSSTLLLLFYKINKLTRNMTFSINDKTCLTRRRLRTKKKERKGNIFLHQLFYASLS